MAMQPASSKSAIKAYQLVNELQAFLISRLDNLPPRPSESRFRPVSWLRSEGRHGGGTRYMSHDQQLFNRASINVSQVQYEYDPKKTMSSATAISAIVHPHHPHAPSMHMHISWTEMKSGQGYWRIMADLNPSIPNSDDQALFETALRESVSPELYSYGSEQGARYFFIPALNRHRGVAHFYLEDFNSGNFASDLDLARRFGRKVIEAYTGIVGRVLSEQKPITPEESQKQREYHSVYFLQVLTLDRGTTSGLLVHDENDIGILGSLPAYVDTKLLESFVIKLPPLQQKLLTSLLSALPEGKDSAIEDSTKAKLAHITRQFYQKYPEAQELLARAEKLPPTQQNHQ